MKIKVTDNEARDIVWALHTTVEQFLPDVQRMVEPKRALDLLRRLQGLENMARRIEADFKQCGKA
jgi:hypothetical protein